MKRGVYSILIAIALAYTAFIAGCKDREPNHPTLLLTEQLMSTRPDSALAILQRIDTLSLQLAADKAL